MVPKDNTAKKQNGTKKKSNETRVPKTVQQSIPYVRVYADDTTSGGVIETHDGVFTKSYLISDTNYSDAGEIRQEEILKEMEKIFNTFSSDCTYQVTVNNRTIDQSEFSKRVLIPYRTDEHDKWRSEHNNMVITKMQEGKNNLKAEKYLTVAVNAPNIRDALERFKSIEKDLVLKFKKINISCDLLLFN